MMNTSAVSIDVSMNTTILRKVNYSVFEFIIISVFKISEIAQFMTSVDAFYLMSSMENLLKNQLTICLRHSKHIKSIRKIMVIGTNALKMDSHSVKLHSPICQKMLLLKFSKNVISSHSEHQFIEENYYFLKFFAVWISATFHFDFEPSLITWRLRALLLE